jgi:hypothetical protein
MPTHHRNLEILWVLLAKHVCDKSGRAYDIECSDTEQPAGVKNASFLENLYSNGNGAINWIGDYSDKCFGAEFCDTSKQTGNHIRIRVEQILQMLLVKPVARREAANTVTSHTRFPRNTCRYNDQFSTSQCFLETMICRQVSPHFGWCVYMIKVSGDTDCMDDIVESKFGHQRAL